MKTIELDIEKIKDKITRNIKAADERDWSYYLVVDDNGEHHVVTAMKDRAWNPWKDDEYAAELPAPYAGGDQTNKDAVEFLKICYSEHENIHDALSTAETCYPIEWTAWQAAALTWYANEWLQALNGYWNSIDIEEAWQGMINAGGHLVERRPPFRFTYGVDDDGVPF